MYLGDGFFAVALGGIVLQGLKKLLGEFVVVEELLASTRLLVAVVVAPKELASLPIVLAWLPRNVPYPGWMMMIVPRATIFSSLLKKEDGISGVAILPIKNNCLGLIKIYRHAVSSFCWEVPRGFVDENENTDDEEY